MKSLVVLGLFLSLPALAADTSHKLHESKLIAAEKWDDVTENLKSWIPGSVVKEFKTSVDGKPFPSVRKLKYGIQITQNNGMRVTVQFKSNGRISFNGKDWRFKPLESIDNQVEQLALFLSGDQKRAGFDVIPSAMAAENSGANKGAFGLAALAFASANAWKADACDETNLTDELLEDCTLMAVAMRMDIDGWKKQARGYGLFGEIRRAAVETGKDKGGFYPVALKCPQNNKGILELISKKPDGESNKYWLKFEKEKPVLFIGYVAKNGSNFEEGMRLDLTTEDQLEKIKNGTGVTKKGLLIYEEVCLASESSRKRFLAALESNKDLLKAYSSNETEDSEENKKSIESI